MTETLDLTDERDAEGARAILEAGGCTAIKISGEGASWFVTASLASPDGIEHSATAYSAKNPNTPNDATYLAGSLLHTLQRNAAAHMRGLGLVAEEEVKEVFSRETDSEHYTPQDSGDFGSEMLAAEEEAGASTPVDTPESMAEELTPSTPENIIETEAEPAVWAVNPEEETHPVDADFTEPDPPDLVPSFEPFGDLEGPVEPVLLEDFAEAPVTEEPEPQSVAHLYGDSLHIMRLAKKGRLDEIAREKKREILGDWSPSEFREQQAQLTRFARGELGAGPEAIGHFDRVAAKVAAIEQVERFHEGRSLALDSPDRAFVEAFNPEAGWP